MSNDQSKSERPGVAEKYTSATGASSLVVDAERAGHADLLIASGWNRSRLGSALLRLHSEADATSEPMRLPATSVQVLARAIAQEHYNKGKRANNKVTAADEAEAQQQAGEWFLQEHALRLQRLKTLPAVRDQLALWAAASSIPEPLDVVANAIHWWLNNRCHMCHGLRWQLIPGTPKLSNRACDACEGSGVRPMPDGVQTKLVLTYINECVSAARDLMQQRLRHSIHRK